MRHSPIGRKGDILHERFQDAGRHLTHLVRHHRITVSVALKHRHFRRCFLGVGEWTMQRQPTRKGNDSAQRFGERQTGVKSQSSTLRKSSEHNSVGGNARFQFAAYDSLDESRSILDTGLVFGSGNIQCLEVEPGVHLKSGVQRDWHHFGRWTNHFHMAGTNLSHGIHPSVSKRKYKKTIIFN